MWPECSTPLGLKSLREILRPSGFRLAFQCIPGLSSFLSSPSRSDREHSGLDRGVLGGASRGWDGHLLSPSLALLQL